MLRVFAFGFAGAFFPEAFAAEGFAVAFAMGAMFGCPKVRDYLLLKQGLKYKIVCNRCKRWINVVITVLSP